jgi:hypothetical protein
MKAKLIFTLGVIIAIVIITMLFSFGTKEKLSIDGAYSIVEVQTVKPDGSLTSVFPKESLVSFSNNYYSFCWTSNISAVHTWQIADSIKLSRYNQSIINAGAFELKDSVLTTKATFALNPMFVNGVAKFKCSFNGDTLVLTGLSVFSSDNIPHPVYSNGSYIVSKLLKVRDK